MALKRTYLDWNATAPLSEAARLAMIEAFSLPGNASSVHTEGRAARAAVEKAHPVRPFHGNKWMLNEDNDNDDDTERGQKLYLDARYG